MDLLKGGAIIGVIVGFWDKIKTFLWMFLSIFIQKVEIKTEDIHNEVIGHLVKNFKCLKNYNKVFGSQYESFRNGKYGLVPYEKFGDTMMIFFSQKKYFISSNKMDSHGSIHCHITYILEIPVIYCEIIIEW